MLLLPLLNLRCTKVFGIVRKQLEKVELLNNGGTVECATFDVAYQQMLEEFVLADGGASSDMHTGKNQDCVNLVTFQGKFAPGNNVSSAYFADR